MPVDVYQLWKNMNDCGYLELIIALGEHYKTEEEQIVSYGVS